MVGYNLTGIGQNSTNIVSLVQGVNNSLTGGWLFTLILIALGIIMFTSFFFRTNDVGKSLLGSVFLCFLLAALLRTLSLVPNLTLYITLIIAAGVAVFVNGKR